ncbi:MAG: hypothetical protein ACXVAX_10135, partial [Pseudobdellovibrio sp.]
TSLTCRKFDYNQLAGDRKVFDVALTKQNSDLYTLNVSNSYEVIQADGSYKVRDKADAITPIPDMLCAQADASLDPKLVTCRKDKGNTFDYVSVRRMDSTSIMSLQASVPGKVIHYSSYDIELMPTGQKDEVLRQFDLKDCVVE